LGGTFFIAVTLAWLLERETNPQLSSWSGTLWWGFVTATTVGYGDQVPITNGGKIAGVFLVIAGLSGAGLLSGSIASFLVSQKIREGRGVRDLSKTKNHFLILGWKKDMEKVLTDILDSDPKLTSSELVIVGHPEQDQVDVIKAGKRFSDLVFIRGDYTSESVLKRVNPREARKALIVADDAQGGQASEVDSRTILASISLHTLAPNIYTCAELLNQSLERHLKNADVNEILYSREYSRAMLANSAVSNGFAAVMHDLMSPASGVRMRAWKVPEELIDHPFSEVAEHFRSQVGGIAIGILENTGNENIMRQEALLEAQRTPDARRLVENLRKVKEIVFNKPILSPKADYPVKSHSMMIVIENHNLDKEIAA